MGPRTGLFDQRAAVSREVGAIQLQMVHRGPEQKALREQIMKLEAEVGLARTDEAK